MNRRPLVLGVDGGGSKSLALLADGDGNILTRRTGAATNPNVVGFEASVRTLRTLINDCCTDVRCRVDELGSIVLGLAGAGLPANRAKIHQLLSSQFHRKGVEKLPITIETDARVALEAAFGGGPGVVLVAGTGSVVIGKTPRGDIIRVGGWGRLLGDEGGGYWIGREGLRAVTALLDGRGEKTKLKDVFIEKYGWKSRDEIVTSVYNEQFDLASLAPIVFEVASAGDLVAQRILQKGGNDLIDQARVVVMQLGLLRKVGLVFLGGLLEPGSIFANVVHMKVLRSLPQADVRPSLHEPAHGAILLALQHIKNSH